MMMMMILMLMLMMIKIVLYVYSSVAMYNILARYFMMHKCVVTVV